MDSPKYPSIVPADKNANSNSHNGNEENPLSPGLSSDSSNKSIAQNAPFFDRAQQRPIPDISIGAIIKGGAAAPLTTFEKKAALINVEMDKFGLGKYQICIWFLCGFGYFLDLAWAQGVGLAASAIYQEMGVPDAQTGTIFAASNAGLAIGALSFGLLVDVIGRRWAFNLTCLITSIFGLLLVRSPISSISSIH